MNYLTKVQNTFTESVTKHKPPSSAMYFRSVFIPNNSIISELS